MTAVLPDLEQELSTLKDFQRRTVDYVFRRLYQDEPPAHRFLIADEVGLGKTLVARGIIGRTLHHLHREGIERIDVVYLCSNQDIARQNLNRLNVTERDEIALPTRLTMLPTQIQGLESRHVNFVSLTPGTSLETTKSRQGRKEERVVLYQILAKQNEVSRAGLRNLLQATVDRENWEQEIRSDFDIDTGLARRFLAELKDDRKLWERLVETARDFRWRTDRHRVPGKLSSQRYEVIGQLRRLMAGVCVEALEPDLIILDEFQRFRDLLDGDSEAARLTRELLDYQEASGYRARVLLLSATPYRMLSLYDEEEDHYEDFLRTCRFLFDGDGDRVEALERNLRTYRQRLYELRGDRYEGASPRTGLEEARREVEDRLLSIMVRTERAAGTGSRDAMLAERRIHAPLKPADLDQARTVDRVSRALESYDPMEYWKSAPYLLNLMRGYKLHDDMLDRTDAPPPDLMGALRDAEGELLEGADFDRYRELDPANGRLRALLDQTLEGGQWKLLWMPPSLPYLRPEGPYRDVESTTKALVFSKWRVVPEAIAALGSYAAERRMLAGDGEGPSYGELHDVVTRPLTFTVQEGRPTGMNPLMLLYPSPTLAELGDPLRLALEAGGAMGDPDAALHEVERRVRGRLDEVGVDLDREGGPLPDQRWYRVALARLDRDGHPELKEWVRQKSGWQSAGLEGFGVGFRDHAEQFAAGFGNEQTLGAPPDDLPRVLAKLALASPAVCAYRALRRASGIENPTDRRLLEASARIADGFRTLFNRPATVSFLQGQGEDLRYWERMLRYSRHGNLQAVLDEYAHVLRESLGLADASSGRVVEEVSGAMTDALSLGTGRIHLDELRPHPRGNRIDVQTLRLRARFALRFGTIQDETGETVARRGGVRQAFNSPFRPFILATTSVGQEGLDFHTYCHTVYHWNLPSNPVDLEQREGRVHRYKGHAIRKNLAAQFGLGTLREAKFGSGEGAAWTDPWRSIFDQAESSRPSEANDLIPYWVFDDGPSRVERRVPLLPFSREASRLDQLKGSLAVYRMVFGQPRQQDLLAYLQDRGVEGGEGGDLDEYRISLTPPEVTVEQEPVELEEVVWSTEQMSVRSGQGPSSSDEMIEELVDDVRWFAPRYEAKENRHYVGLQVDGKTDNFALFKPKSYGLRLEVKIQEDDPVVRRLRGAGCEVLGYRPYAAGPGIYPIQVPFQDFGRLRPLLREALVAAYRTSARRG